MSELAATNGSLANANVHAFVQGVGIDTLQTCLGGVKSAFGADRGQEQRPGRQGHLGRLGCLHAAGRRHEQRAGLSVRLPRPGRHPGGPDLLRLRDQLGGREHPDHRLHRPDPLDRGRQCPAEPSQLGHRRLHLGARRRRDRRDFFSRTTRSTSPASGQECISVATASRPQGPFTDKSTAPLECQKSLGGSIDPASFIDTDGTPVPRVEVGRPGLVEDLVPATSPRLARRSSPGAIQRRCWCRTSHGRAGPSRPRTWSPRAGTTTSSSRATTGTARTTRWASPRARARSVRAATPHRTPSCRAGRAWRVRRRVGVRRYRRELLDRVPRLGPRRGGVPQQP